jgi:hypothetical protein
MTLFWQLLAVGAFGIALGYAAHWWTARREMQALRDEVAAYVAAIYELRDGLKAVQSTLAAPDEDDPLSPATLLRDAELYAAIDDDIANGRAPF